MTIAAVVPLRFADCCTADGAPRFLLRGRPLWDTTFEQVCAAEGIDDIVAAYDDDRLLPFLEAWPTVRPLRRPPELSLANATTMDVLAWVAGMLDHQGRDPDFVMLLEISHPLRPKGVIGQIAQAARQAEVDSLITCHPIHYNFWRRDEQGEMRRISGSGERADVALFQELTGICSLFSPRWLRSGNPFGERVDVVPIDRFWAAIDVRDADGLWLAERYLERIGQSSP